VYPLLINRSADRIATISQDDPSTQLHAPTLPRTLPTSSPAPVGAADQSPVTSERAHGLSQPRRQLRTVTEGSDQGGGLVPDRQISPPPSASVPARALAPQSAAATPATPPAAARAPVQAPAAAMPRVTEGGGFFVQLSALKSEAEAQSTFRALKSKYAVLKGHEPVILRKDEGQHGMIYAVQVGPFVLRDDADQLCKQLKTAGGICFVTRN